MAATYPKLRARSGSVEGIEKRVVDCMERSLNGRAVPDSRPTGNGELIIRQAEGWALVHP
ncbi:hypothetical protein AUC43_07590 [Hymenobacter sedentarius]|uniref:Uncharacterized protein n=1 Tax=Hymenobacter sedentarius TaxID=1411621 RepID=A0A0U4AN60_9BACT|nr:hypothetical protein AUC43_07590 [Hymenobacter sedentarius]